MELSYVEAEVEAQEVVEAIPAEVDDAGHTHVVTPVVLNAQFHLLS